MQYFFPYFDWIQPGKHEDKESLLEMGRLSNKREMKRRRMVGKRMRNEERGAVVVAPSETNSGILILICRAAPAHQLSTQTSGHPPPSSCHCRQKKKSFQVLLFSQKYIGVMKAEGRLPNQTHLLSIETGALSKKKEKTCKRRLHGQSSRSFSTSAKKIRNLFETREM